MTRIRVVGGVCLALFCASVAGRGTAAPVVAEIQVCTTGPGKTDESFVRAHIGCETGRELDRQRLSRDVKALLATGVFSDVTVEAETMADGMRLVYTVVNKLILAQRPDVSGVSFVRERQIRKLIALQAGDLFDDHDLASLAARVREDYRSKFRPDASVTWETEVTDADEGLARVTFVVDEGEKDRIRRFRFSGNEVVSSRDLWKAVETRKWWNPMRWFKRRRYDIEELEVARVGVLDVYLNRGYLDTQVDVPEIEHDAKDRLTAVFTIREGRLYRFGEVNLEGIETFPEAEVAREVGAKQGEPASADVLRKTVEQVENYYGSRGYIEARAAPVLDADPDTGVVDVRLAVTEGGLFHIRNIRVRGNDRTRDKVIRREIRVFPGDIYNTSEVSRSERIINNLGFFSRVRAYPADTSEPGRKDVIIDVEEKRTGQFMIGAGFSSVDKVIGFAELSQGNFDIMGWPYFMGAGQKLKLRAQVGQTRKVYELSFVEPWFLDRRVSLGCDLYRSEVDYTDYDVQRTGGSIAVGRALPGANRVNLRYRLERVLLSGFADTNDYVYVDSPEEEYVFEDEEDRIESSLLLTLTHDTRNNPFVPSKGTMGSLFGSVSGGPLGFDTDIYGVGAKVTQYVPLWWRHVLSFRAHYEVVEAYGNSEEVPLADRLFIGGGRTLRGFDWRDVGPKVVPTTGSGAYRAVGGGSLAFASAEYAVPVVEGIRLAAFYDTGNVWRDPYVLEVDDLASSAGVGIRVDLPGFPIRVDRAWVIRKDHEITREDPWVVWIGYDY